jgi:hypothetical protein
VSQKKLLPLENPPTKGQRQNKQDQKSDEQDRGYIGRKLATPPKPKRAATMAMIKNVMAHLSMIHLPFPVIAN